MERIQFALTNVLWSLIFRMNIKGLFLKIRDKSSYLKVRDMLSLVLLPIVLPYVGYLKITEKNIWLVCERRTEARDNGYVFFRYVADNIHSVNAYYAINKKSNDYKKLHNYGRKILSFGSIRHRAYYMACDALVTSVKNCGPDDLLGFLVRKLHLMDNKIFFIQHGITINNVDHFHYNRTGFRAITCGAYPEYKFVSEHFGYPEDRVIFIGGQCRYDYLHSTDSYLRRYVLIMPTWRKWLKHGDHHLKEVEHTYTFTETRYYKNWAGLIRSDSLVYIAEKNNLQFIFYLHPMMEDYINTFESENSNVIIANKKDYDIQALIRNASMLVTDYSSVFFDFIYMKKPIIFFQFDVDDFRKFHYSQGYFRYDDNPFSNTVYCVKEVNEKLEEAIRQEFSVNDEYLEEHKKYFPLYDAKNSERTFREIYKRL